MMDSRCNSKIKRFDCDSRLSTFDLKNEFYDSIEAAFVGLITRPVGVAR